LTLVLSSFTLLLLQLTTMSSEDPILTISVAANLLKLHPRTLMLYEKSGLITPHRTVGSRRLFSLKDLERLQFVKYLSQKQGVNLTGVKIILQTLELAQKKGLRLKRILFPSYRPQALI